MTLLPLLVAHRPPFLLRLLLVLPPLLSCFALCLPVEYVLKGLRSRWCAVNDITGCVCCRVCAVCCRVCAVHDTRGCLL